MEKKLRAAAIRRGINSKKWAKRAKQGVINSFEHSSSFGADVRRSGRPRAKRKKREERREENS